ncbi:hypothetical protein JCM3765_000096 [Sporobolomyces pararoseus]
MSDEKKEKWEIRTEEGEEEEEEEEESSIGTCSLTSSPNSSEERFSSIFITPSVLGRQEPWIKIVRCPSLCSRPLRPGRACHVIFEALEGTRIVELAGRIVGSSKLAYKDRHEFLSIPFSFPSFLLDHHNDNSPTDRYSLEAIETLPRSFVCATCSKAAGSPSLIPLPPSYESDGHKIEYFIEVTGKIDKGSKDRKGKGKWKLFKEKLKTERLEIPFTVNDHSRYDLERPMPPRPLAPEATYRTYPISQESVDGKRRTTIVELLEPRDIGLAAKVYSAKLNLQLTSSVDLSGQLQPSFRYTLLASLGQHVPSTLPLLSSSLQLASSYAHFVLEKSTTLDTSRRPRVDSKRIIPLIHQGERASNSLDSGLMHRDQPGTIDGVWELVQNDAEDEETPSEVFVKFEGEFEVELPERGAGDEESLLPIRSCQIEVRHDLTVTFQFGSDFNSLVMLKSTNLPLHVEAKQLLSHSHLKALKSSSSTPLDKVETEFLVNSEHPRSQNWRPSASSPSLCPPASASNSGQPEDLPAYKPSARPFSADEEKRQLALNEHAQQSTSTSRLPEYTQASTEVGLTEEVGARDPEEPPSWEETVRDDMIDDWVAASVALSTDEN